MGARPLRRAIQRYIEDPLADFVLRAELDAGATVLVEVAPEDDDRDLVLTVVRPEKAPTPVAVGGRKEEEPADEGVDDGGALNQPAVEPPAADE
jgi:ATP-dependent Clp protease ATP-binding subunit ClpC